MIRRIRELTRAITQLYEQLAGLVKQTAPQLLAEPGLGVLIAATLIRRDRRDRPLHQRRATRAHLRMRPDPGLIWTD
jgi:hypothetical protein